MKKITAIILAIALLLSLLLTLASCSPLVGVNGKDGVSGVDGKNGEDGKDGVNGNDGADGKAGIDGKDGVNGTVPHVGENGNWWIGDTDTGVRAEGSKGDAGSDGKDGKDGADGTNGKDALASYPIFRANSLSGNFEISYDNGKSWASIGMIAAGIGSSYSLPLSQLNVLDGTVENSTGKFKETPNWRCAVVDISELKHFDYVTLTRNKSGTDLSYCFLKSMPVAGKIPEYATGYSKPVSGDGQERVTLSIPEDAVYLYVYNNDKNGVYTPDSITFFVEK